MTNTEIELSEAEVRRIARLKAIVVGLGVLILICFAIIVTKISLDVAKSARQPGKAAQVQLPAGATFLSASVDDDTLYVAYRDGAGKIVVVTVGDKGLKPVAEVTERR